MTSVSRQTDITLALLLGEYVTNVTLPEIAVTGITSNSRQVKSGDLFVALSGLTSHAIDFVADAVNASAVAVIYDANDSYCRQRIPLLEKQHDISFIPVSYLPQNLGLIASRFYAYPSQKFKLIGVTGTDGKTSVTHLLIQAFNKLNKKAGSVGTLGYGSSNNLKMTNFTTPDAITLQSILFELSLGRCEYVVMEVSSHALEQYRESGCEFDVAVLTNLGSDHLDYHGDKQNYAAAKSRLFEKQNLTGRVLNQDDEFGRALSETYKEGSVINYSVDGSVNSSADVKLHSSTMTPDGIRVAISTFDGLIEIHTGLIGAFNINNLLCCVAVLIKLGFDSQTIEKSMQGLQPIPGRMEYLPATRNTPSVVIDFAHTEQALSACLHSLKEYCAGKLICVFGCGGDRDQSKRPKMAAVAEQLADQVVITDDNPRNESSEQIMRDILSGFSQPERVRVIQDRETAIETAIAEARVEDLVVIAGKGHEKFQIVGSQRLPFSDHFVVKQIRMRSAS